MNNLIKNELTKLFKKKSTYIILIITIAFILLTNIMNSQIQNLYYSSGYDEESIQIFEDEMNSYSPDNPEEVQTYVDIKSKLDMLKLMQKYGFDSWQAYIIQTRLGSDGDLYTINAYTYFKNSVSKEEYETAKQRYNTFIEKLDTDDWKHFVSSELQEVEEQIRLEEKTDHPDASTLNSLKIQKQILEWRLSKNISYQGSFLDSCLRNYQNSSEAVYSYEQGKDHSYEEKLDYYSDLKSLHTSKYYIENEIRNISDTDNRAILLDLFDNYELFILIFIIMIAGGMISDEFSKGTIKLLLVRPYSRNKILLSKLMVCFLMLIFIIAFTAGSQFIIGGIIHGFDSTTVPAVIYNYDTKQIETMNIAMYICITSIAKLPIYILLMTLAFACSTIFVNTAVSIIIPLLGYMGSAIINQLALLYDIKILRYFVTPNWDLSQYLFGGLSNFEGLTMPFSIIICLVYFLIMLVTSFIVFKKRNIKNV